MSIETWTTERVEQLQSFVVAGMSCSQIAAQIGVTRNAVIGKIHRLGLSPVRPPGAMARNCSYWSSSQELVKSQYFALFRT